MRAVLMRANAARNPGRARVAHGPSALRLPWCPVLGRDRHEPGRLPRTTLASVAIVHRVGGQKHGGPPTSMKGDADEGRDTGVSLMNSGREVLPRRRRG
jgi:hypothetical protein